MTAPTTSASKTTTAVAAAVTLAVATTTIYLLLQRRRRSFNAEDVWSLAGDNAELTSVLGATGATVYDDHDDENVEHPKLLTTLTRAGANNNQHSPKPTVVFVHGFGCTALEFGALARQTSQALQVDVVTVDRIVLTHGELPQPRTAQVLAHELMAVLKRRNIAPPYVLVGHSYGGLVVQVAAELYNNANPGKNDNAENIISGLVLLDPAHERQFDPDALPRDFTWGMHLSPFMFRIYQRFMAPVGLLHLLDACNQFIFPPIHLIDCKQTRRAACHLYSKPQAWAHVIDEWHGCLLTFEQRRKQPQNLRLPPGVLVIANHRQYSPTFYPNEITRAFLRLHEPLLASNKETWKLVMADHSDHWIHLQQPQLVLDVIRNVLERTAMMQ